jgi:cytochrome c peroxidase
VLLLPQRAIPGRPGLANVGAPQIGPGGSKQPPLDLGRGELDNNEFYQFAFRVAPLRNVELTAPYFHSGAFRTLEEVVHHYNDATKSLTEYDPSRLDADVRPFYRGEPSHGQRGAEYVGLPAASPARAHEAEIGRSGDVFSGP